MKFLFLSTVLFSTLLGNPQLEPLTEQMKNINKSEQHLHIGGSWPLSFLKEVATPEEYAALTGMIDQIQEGLDYHAAFQVFVLIGKIMNTEERIENGVAALCADLIRDQVTYAEFRTGLKNLGNGFEGYLESVLRGIEKGTAGTHLKVGLILSLRRDTTPKDAYKTIDLANAYAQKGVVGIDVSGDSTVGDVKNILPPLIYAKNLGLPITLHIGESKKESAELQMMELQTLQPQRIGHGVHLCIEAVEWIKSNQVLVEMCLTSALKTGMISEMSEHPALKLLLEGHPVSICTDDPLIFNTTLSQEYAYVGLITGLSPEAIEALQKETEKYHFLR
jgi:adenosine deaminase